MDRSIHNIICTHEEGKRYSNKLAIGKRFNLRPIK